MPITEAERRFLDEVSLDLPWALVEQFATMRKLLVILNAIMRDKTAWHGI